MADSEPSNVAFLLGAGASVEAGCPTVRDLAESFRASLGSNSRLVAAFDWIHSQIQASRPGEFVDIENVLAAIRVLQERDNNILSSFLTRAAWRAEVRKYSSALPKLESQLQRHIRAECERGRAVDYLRPLLEIAESQGVLDVFTLNYDYTIELACQQFGMPVTDGFGTYWDPSLFSQMTQGIRLHKIHGSLSWYETSRSPRNLVKIPVISNGRNDIRFFSDDAVSNVLIYPTIAKESHAEPYSTLISRLRENLRQADHLIAIGYSFRDRYIKDVVLEKMHENPKLQLTVIDPSASSVLKHSDTISGKPWAFSKILRKVRPLELGAGQSLEGGYLARILQSGLRASRAISEAREHELQGARQDRIERLRAATGALLDAHDYGALTYAMETDAEDAWADAVAAFDPALARSAFVTLLSLARPTDERRDRFRGWWVRFCERQGAGMQAVTHSLSGAAGPPDRDGWRQTEYVLRRWVEQFGALLAASSTHMPEALRPLCGEVDQSVRAMLDYAAVMARGALVIQRGRGQAPVTVDASLRLEEHFPAGPSKVELLLNALA